MASTNKTTHYELSQYIGTDKPTYLTDYNQDMSKIDAGIYGAKSIAYVNSAKIGDLTDLDTTDKSDLVSAINEVNSNEESLSGTVSGHTVSIGDLQGDVGNLVDLDTIDKSDLVGAINEVNTQAGNNKVDIGNLNNLYTTTKSNLVGAINEVLSELNTDSFTTLTFSGGGRTFNLTLAKNSDGSMFKLYGYPRFTPASTGNISFTASSSLRPSQAYDIVGAGITVGTTAGVLSRPITISVATNGTITLRWYNDQNSSAILVWLPPCMYLNKSFGD